MSRARMLWCQTCKEYTLHAACHRCGAEARPRKPAKYSPEDPYGDYRRRLKRLERSQ